MAPAQRSVEVEWQFAVRDVDGLERWLSRVRLCDGWSVSPSTTQQLRDTYFDTPDWRVWRAGYALRVRRWDERVEATLKALRRAHGGLARRREITERLRDARLGSLRAAVGPVGVRLSRVSGEERLLRLFTLRTRRRVLVLWHDRRAVAEIALDRTWMLSPRHRARRFERLEVEVTAGPAALVARFVAVLRRRRRLTIAARSKFEEGLAWAGRIPPRRP